LEYDSATFASYVNTLQRQHYIAEKLPSGYGARHQHDWFNAKSAAVLVEASQSRVSQRKVVMDNEMENPDEPDDGWDSRHRDRAGRSRSESSAPGHEFEEDEAAMRDAMGSGQAEDDDDVMEIIATQAQAVQRSNVESVDETVDEEMREVGDSEEAPQPMAAPPPTFRPVHFDLSEQLEKSVNRRMKKNHEPVLEELPKWSLLAKILKEIEDTMARIQKSHAGMLLET
jgi:DNA excision repair protein ERCC-4